MLTFVIPVGNYHRDIAERALESVRAQSIPCAAVVVYDTECKGAGYARNRGLERVTTPFVSFLDADDWLEPDFAEKCLRAYTGRHYIYTDWWGWAFDKDAQQYIPQRKDAPQCPWTQDNWHVNTTVIPTAFVQRVGGYDETLPFCEDAEFYLKLKHSGLCGKLLPLPLFHYGKDGQRARQMFVDGYEPEKREPVYTAKYHEVITLIKDRYKGLPMPQDCGGCGGMPNPDVPSLPANQSFEGAALATALWAGNRQVRGRITGTLYPRSGNGKQLFVHERDIDAAPHEFARVVELPPPVSETDFQAWRNLTGQLHEALGAKAAVQQAPAPTSAQRGEVQPDVPNVLRLYQQHT